MTINRTTLLDLPLPVTGTESNTWGDVVNYGLTEYLDIAIAGSLALSTDADVLLASTEGTASADNIGGTTAQYAVLRCTGARTVTRNITAPAWAISSGTLTDYSKTYIVVNETTGGQNIVLRATNSATPTYTTGVTIVPGERAVCVWNGSDFVKAGGVIGGSNTQVQYNNGGVLGGIANATSDGTTLSLTSPKVITGINDTNGNELLKVTATASAVNELTLANAATGNAPTLSATGDDTNIGINITPKGSGAVTISNLAVTTIDATNIEVTNIKAKDGTASITLADSTGVASFTANPVLSGGTASGVLYLNGSKVATSGSALTFDGTNLGVGNSAFAWNTAAFNNAIDLSVYGAIYSTSSVAGVTGNVYYDGSAWHIKTNGPSTRYDQTAGSHVFYAAPTPVGLGNTTPTFVEILRLNTTGITLDGGTANGVLYLNGSKVATSGSALTFDGTSFSASNQIIAGIGVATANVLARSNVSNGGSGFSQFLFGNASTDTRGFLSYSHASEAILFGTSSAEQMRLTSTGLGIGTTLQNGTKLNVMGGNIIPATSGSTQNGGLRVSSLTTGGGGYVLDMGVSDTNGYAWMQVSNSQNLASGFTKDLVLQPNGGNLGLGVTPSAWGGSYKTIQLPGGNIGAFGTQAITIFQNAYDTGAGSYVYLTSAAASRYTQSVGLHQWFTAASGTAGDPITFTQAMTLFPSGGLAIGATGDPGAGSLVLDGGTGAGRITLGAVSAGNTIFSTTTGFGAYRALNFQTASSVTMTLDSSGNLGLGVTPSAWTNGRIALQIGGSTVAGLGFAGAISETYTNAYVNSGVYKYYTTGPAGIFDFNNAASGGFSWRIAGSGTAGNAITFTQAMTLDSSGNLGLGVTPSAWNTFKTMQIGAGASVFGHQTTVDEAYLSANLYFSSGNKYIGSGAATLYSQSAGSHSWSTATSGTAGNAITFTQAMTLDASGNLGLGETSPYSLSNYGAMTIRGSVGGLTMYRAGATNIGYIGGNNSDELFIANLRSSGYITLSTNSTERARITSGGDLLVGETSAGYSLANRGLIELNGTSSALFGLRVGAASKGYLLHEGTNLYLSNDANGAFIVNTNATERARITSGGAFYVGTTTAPTATAPQQVVKSGASDWVSYVWNSNAAPYGLRVQHDTDTNGTGNQFLFCAGSPNLRAEIRSNGGLANYSANDVNLSDRREKTNFAPAKSYLDTICAIPVQTFNYIDQSENDPGLTLGVVAQDVQAVAPELVMESNWGTEDNPKMRLSIYQTDLQYALMKCIQEQQALIQSLTARVALLEGN